MCIVESRLYVYPDGTRNTTDVLRPCPNSNGRKPCKSAIRQYTERNIREAAPGVSQPSSPFQGSTSTGSTAHSPPPSLAATDAREPKGSSGKRSSRSGKGRASISYTKGSPTTSTANESGRTWHKNNRSIDSSESGTVYLDFNRQAGSRPDSWGSSPGVVQPSSPIQRENTASYAYPPPPAPRHPYVTSDIEDEAQESTMRRKPSVARERPRRPRAPEPVIVDERRAPTSSRGSSDEEPVRLSRDALRHAEAKAEEESARLARIDQERYEAREAQREAARRARKREDDAERIGQRATEDDEEEADRQKRRQDRRDREEMRREQNAVGEQMARERAAANAREAMDAQTDQYLAERNATVTPGRSLRTAYAEQEPGSAMQAPPTSRHTRISYRTRPEPTASARHPVNIHQASPFTQPQGQLPLVQPQPPFGETLRDRGRRVIDFETTSRHGSNHEGSQRSEAPVRDEWAEASDNPFDPNYNFGEEVPARRRPRREGRGGSSGRIR